MRIASARRNALRIAIGLVFVMCAVRDRAFAATYRSELTVWTRAHLVAPQSHRATLNLARALWITDSAAALRLFQELR